MEKRGAEGGEAYRDATDLLKELGQPTMFMEEEEANKRQQGKRKPDEGRGREGQSVKRIRVERAKENINLNEQQEQELEEATNSDNINQLCNLPPEVLEYILLLIPGSFDKINTLKLVDSHFYVIIRRILKARLKEERKNIEKEALLLNMSPLHLAADRGSKLVVKHLIKNGSDVNERDTNGYTLLKKAVEIGDFKLIKLLIENGATVKTRDEKGDTVLHRFIKQVNILLNKRLKDLGLNVDLKNIDRNTLLYLTITNLKNHYAKEINAIIKLLLERGADINAKNDDGLTLLHSAVQEGQLEIVRLLLGLLLERKANIGEEGKIDEKDNSERSPLYIACEHGHLQIANILIESGADKNSCSSWDWETPLHLAAKNGHTEIARLLIAKGADMHLEDKRNNMSPLHYACKHGHLEVVNIFIENRANINACSSNCDSPLHCAVFAGHIEVVRLLLDNGADIESEDSCGNTPLHSAIQKFKLEGSMNHVEIIKLLLERGADLNAINRSGNTARELIHELSQLGIIIQL